MPLLLDVEGKQIPEPDSSDIVQAFESFEAGVSYVALTRDDAHSITATAHPDGGFLLSLEDGEPDCLFHAEKSFSRERVIAIFQAYARGDDWGRSAFQWERTELKPEKRIRWFGYILLACALAYAAFVLLKSMHQN